MSHDTDTTLNGAAVTPETCQRRTKKAAQVPSHQWDVMFLGQARPTVSLPAQ